MSATASIVAIVAVLGALVLAYRGLQSHGLTLEKKAKMAIAWVAIILGLVLLLRLLGA